MTQTTNSTPSPVFTPDHPIVALATSFGLPIVYVHKPHAIAEIVHGALRLDAASPICEATDAVLRVLASLTRGRAPFTAADCLILLRDGNGVAPWNDLTVNEVAAGLLFARLTPTEAVNVVATVLQEVCEAFPELIPSHLDLVARTAKAVDKLTSEEHTPDELRTAYWLLGEVLDTGDKDNLPDVLGLMTASLHRCFDETEAEYAPAEVGISLMNDLAHRRPETEGVILETLRGHISHISASADEAAEA